MTGDERERVIEKLQSEIADGVERVAERERRLADPLYSVEEWRAPEYVQRDARGVGIVQKVKQDALQLHRTDFGGRDDGDAGTASPQQTNGEQDYASWADWAVDLETRMRDGMLKIMDGLAAELGGTAGRIERELKRDADLSRRELELTLKEIRMELAELKKASGNGK